MEAVSYFEKNYSIGELDDLYEKCDYEFPCGGGHIILAHAHKEKKDEH